MKLSRDLTWKIRYVIDEFIPPAIRDSKIFSLIMFRLFYKLLYKDKGVIFLNFKQKAPSISEQEFRKIYKIVNSIESRDTDLNVGCEKEILRNVVGNSVLEVGCGKGYLSKKLSKKYIVTACDIVIDKQTVKKGRGIKFRKGNVENLPFASQEFDTAICTHTLEHVQNLSAAISELRRVTKKRLIIVVPKQRPYRLTFDLHLHFFPYNHSLELIMRNGQNHKSHCKEIDGDLFYVEDK